MTSIRLVVTLFAFGVYLTSAIGVQAQTSTQPQKPIVLRADDYYPLPKSPDATVLIGEVTLDPTYGEYGCPVAELHAHAKPGELTLDNCDIGDGVCCTCNVTRGFTPECGFIVSETPGGIHTECTKTWPPGYFGNTSFIEIDPKIVVARHGHRKWRRRVRRMRPTAIAESPAPPS